MSEIRTKGLFFGGGLLAAVAVVLAWPDDRGGEMRSTGADHQDGAVAPVRRDPGTSSRNRALTRLDRIAGGEIEVIGAEMARILGQSDPAVRSQEWLDFVASIDPTRMEEVVDAFRVRGLEVQRSEYAILLSEWSKDGPREALAYVGKELSSGDFERSTILARWAENDAAAALAWAEQNPSGEEGLNQSILYVAKGIATSQPILAAQLLESQSVIRERPVILGQVLPQILSLGPEEAKLWPEHFEDLRLRRAAMSKIAESLVLEDPVGTMEWINRAGGQARDAVYREAVSALAKSDSEAALGYALEAPEGDARAMAFSGLIRSVARKDPGEAAQIIDAYPEQVTDGGVQGFVWSAVQREPALAAEYLSRIEGTEALNSSLRVVIANWRRKDPAALEAWLAGNPQYRQP